VRSEVHLVEVGGFLYASLPRGRNARFQKKMNQIGVLVELDENPHASPVYRMLTEERSAFEELVRKYYPDRVWRYWGWQTWNDIPPWAREALSGFVTTTLFTKLFGITPEEGLPR
jgi:hypothetical protein